MKNFISLKKIFTVFSLSILILFSSVVYAAPSQIIFFCSSWNMKCREAKQTYSSLAKELGMNFVELDIDEAYSQQKANDLGLDFPSTIPYIYILGNKNNVLKAKVYNGESVQDLKKELLK